MTKHKVVQEEIASTRDGRDITLGFVGPMELLQPRDQVLQLRGGGFYGIYQEVMRDWQVASTFQQRRLAVVSREWQVHPGGTRRVDKAAAAFLEEQLRELPWDSITDKMLYGVFYGYAVAECLWSRDGRHVVLEGLRVRARDRFGWDGAGRLRLKTTANPYPGELLPERKFWSFQTGADHDDEPYGLGLAHWLYWPVWFRRNGLKFWLIFLEKFGQPTAVGRFPPGTSEQDQQKLLQATQAIYTDSGVVIPDGMLLELVEAARSGSADYDTLYERMEQAIAKVVLGQVMTSEATGGQYKAEVQMDVRMELVKADADVVCQSFNRSVARWLTEWNFPGAAVPQVWRVTEDPEDLNAVAERAERMARVGYRPTLREVTAQLGGEWEAVPGMAGSPKPSGAPASEFAEAAAPDVPELLADQLEGEAEAASDAMVEPIRRLLHQVDTLEEFRDGMAAAFTDMPVEDLAEVMGRAFVVAELGGRWEVLDEAGDG